MLEILNNVFLFLLQFDNEEINIKVAIVLQKYQSSHCTAEMHMQDTRNDCT
jgi:hypothetical protein